MNTPTPPRIGAEADLLAIPDSRQSDFAVRCDGSLSTYERTGHAIPVDVVLSKLEDKVAARVDQLRQRGP